MFMLSVVLFAVVAASHANVYYAYDKESPNTPVLIPTDVDANTEGIPIDSTLPTIVLVHGHQGDLNSEFNQMVKREILAYRDSNLIVVDWSTYSKLSYSNAAGGVPIVSSLLASFLTKLVTEYQSGQLQFQNFHLVGFNLGAHVVGAAAREIFRWTGQRVARITGLDPSSSQWGSGSSRLTNTDANYVEVIHTDGDGILSNGLGTAIGDVDFFVNGGSNQPGCLTHACSHNRAYELFAGTFVRAEKLYGNFCANNAQLTLNRCTSQRLHIGDDDLDKARVNGVYRVNTGRNYPY